jgi:hypothetical protein
VFFTILGEVIDRRDQTQPQIQIFDDEQFERNFKRAARAVFFANIRCALTLAPCVITMQLRTV